MPGCCMEQECQSDGAGVPRCIKHYVGLIICLFRVLVVVRVLGVMLKNQVLEVTCGVVGLPLRMVWVPLSLEIICVVKLWFGLL